MALDIEERHLLRLGHGEEELATEKDFSRFGRVNFILSLRMELLKEVECLQVSGSDVTPLAFNNYCLTIVCCTANRMPGFLQSGGICMHA